MTWRTLGAVAASGKTRHTEVQPGSNLARENSLYGFKGARSAPGPGWQPILAAPREECAERAAAQLPPVTGRPSGDTLSARAPPAALRPCRATAASARESFPRPAAPAPRRNDQCQALAARRAFLPALQCEARQDHAKERFASHVMACGHSCG